MPNRQQIEHIVTGCISANRQSQKELYQNYYGFATSICMRYSNVNNDTVEIVNDGFLKIFKSIHLFVPKYENFETSLLGWMKSILVHTAIDHFRKNGKNYLVGEVADDLNELSNTDVSAIDKMSYKEIIELVQKLSPVYRTVFNMFVIDGYKHEEIAEHLHISVGTSKSNLAKAKANIKKMLSTPKFKLYGIRAI